MRTRIEWLDIAKGIGILLVIAGHCFYLAYSRPIYAFHMPLFFFLSGLLYRDKNEKFNDFVKSKTSSLMRPWVIMLFISFLICLAIPQWRNEITFPAVLSDLYTANTNVFQNSSLWYLVCYYCMLLIFYFTNKVKMTISSVIAGVAIAIGLLWIKELLNMSNLPLHRLPFKIDSALIALVFFTVAYNLKDKLLTAVEKEIKPLVITTIVFISAMLCALNGWSNINSLDFGNIRLLYYPIAFSGIVSVVLVSKYISKMNCGPLIKFFSFYGKHSLLIFGFQSLLIRLYLLCFSSIEGVSMPLYGANPMIHQVGSFVIVSFVLSPMVVVLVSLLRRNKMFLL